MVTSKQAQYQELKTKMLQISKESEVREETDYVQYTEAEVGHCFKTGRAWHDAAFNPRTPEAEAGGYEPSLVYIASSKTLFSKEKQKSTKNGRRQIHQAMKDKFSH